MAKIEEKIGQMVEPVIEKNGMELVDVEFVKEGQEWFLRIFIDKEDGITLDDCELISRAVSDILDREDPISQSYHLEVSSPGIERPLKKTKDFLRFINNTIEIKTFSPIAGKKKHRGKLIKADEDNIALLVGQEEIVFPRDMISKANLVWED
ncbi:MAG: ribosome maturation factor RimP [Clostridia bacterium]|nr:ribosome maturation factor RimP [Clostridia bacterium]